MNLREYKHVLQKHDLFVDFYPRHGSAAFDVPDMGFEEMEYLLGELKLGGSVVAIGVYCGVTVDTGLEYEADF